MILEFDIHSYLVTHADMWFFEEHAEEAADQLNEMLHYIVTYAESNDRLETLEEVIRRALFDWIENPELLALDSEEMQTYILEQLADARQQETEEDD